MGLLDNKVAIITGGASGMGKAFTKAFLNEGAKVVYTDIQEQPASQNPNELFIQQDVSQEADWNKVMQATLEKFGKVNIVVNNAGISKYQTIEEVTKEDWDKIIGVNLTGVMWGNKYAVKAMKDNGEQNSIINMSSVGGIIGTPDLTAYCSSKGGVRLLTKSVALYCAKKGYNIRVNSIHPGTIKTPMIAGAMKENPAVQKSLEAAHPMGRIGKPEEIANMAVFLASDKSSFSTGSEFIADGGYTAQ